MEKLVNRKKFINEVDKFSKDVIIETLLNYTSFGVFQEAFQEFLSLLRFTTYKKFFKLPFEDSRKRNLNK